MIPLLKLDSRVRWNNDVGAPLAAPFSGQGKPCPYGIRGVIAWGGLSSPPIPQPDSMAGWKTCPTSPTAFVSSWLNSYTRAPVWAHLRVRPIWAHTQPTS